jgi:hypothetical protein
MRKMIKQSILILTLLTNQIAFANCNVRSASVLNGQNQVGEVTDLKQTIVPGKCTVQFRLNVNGQWHTVEETQADRWTKETALCRDAIRYAKEKLLASIGGKFTTEAITVCREGDANTERLSKGFEPVKLRIGDKILESEAGKSKIENYFTHKNQTCRMFTERYTFKGNQEIYNGVICQNDQIGNNWTVVDRW